VAELNQLDVSTRRYIRDNPALVDNWSQNDPLIAYAKLNTKEIFGGGSLIQEGFTYDAMIGGAYQKGKEFDITEKQVEQAKQFQVKFFEVNVTLSQEDVEVLNKGPLAVFNLIDSRMTTAYQTLGIQMAIALYLNGVNAGFTANFNGLAELVNDGTNVSWDNNTYTSYGGITRGGNVGSALSSTPTNVNGAIQYTTLENTYGNAEFGNIQPNLGVTTIKGYSYIKEKFQTQQRFNDTQDPAIGFNGLKFNSATLIKSRYVPGSYIATTSPQTDANKQAVAYLTVTSNGAVVAYPTLAVASSETLFWMNARKPYFNFYVSDSPKFGFGFTGFKPAQGNTKVAGQVLAACAITGDPRYHQQVFGFTA
jgi:hypothetical protein